MRGPGAEIRSWSRNNQGQRVPGPSAKTDANGLFKLQSSERSHLLLASHGGQRLATANEYWVNRHDQRPQPQQRVDMFARLLTRIQRIPGVQSASAMSGLPPSRDVNANDTTMDGYKAPPELSPEEAASNPFYGGQRFFCFRRVEDLGGVIPAIDKGFFQSEINW